MTWHLSLSKSNDYYEPQPKAESCMDVQDDQDIYYYPLYVRGVDENTRGVDRNARAVDGNTCGVDGNIRGVDGNICGVAGNVRGVHGNARGVDGNNPSRGSVRNFV